MLLFLGKILLCFLMAFSASVVALIIFHGLHLERLGVDPAIFAAIVGMGSMYAAISVVFEGD